MKTHGVAVALSLAALALLSSGCEWSACSGDCDDLTEDQCEHPKVTYTVLDSLSPNSIVPSGAFYTLEGSGSGALILIGGHGVACDIRVEGHNNLIRFETADHTVRKCRVDGNDNTIERPSVMEFTCDDGGAGNSFFVY
jgi:hypothetical protein